MNNEQVQTDGEIISIPGDKRRKGRAVFGISRTLKTAQYESIVIYHDIDEEIVWDTPEERSKKVHNWGTVLIQEFQAIHDRILEECNLSHKKAYFKDPPPPKTSLDLDSLDAVS